MKLLMFFDQWKLTVFKRIILTSVLLVDEISKLLSFFIFVYTTEIAI